MGSECVGAAVCGSQVRCEANLYALRGRSQLVGRKQIVRDTIDWKNVNIMSMDMMSKKCVYP